ncbi:undecaprenyl-phosphate glucose phosphotransferase [Psychrosphaera ytuae]|uniref:Undecaprenyl-phosphate glucose phosphotransferase n=1 Tax=Psychrosphaera ytuae TaxID=2820710 RepID=A0A975DCX5_9GAMM|nr:undecaprenyl-phosphate glucose phosphotransferase [Psychrosphaera ytuae]QTH64608.1 undecaprenyl-phosphate glucose phosphotransferase [Psychrosphaera ytuae]
MNERKRGILHNNTSAISLTQRFVDVVVIVLALVVSLDYLGIEWQLQHSTALAIAVFLFHFSSEVDSIYISWRGLSLAKELQKVMLHWFLSFAFIALSVQFLFPEFIQPEALQLMWFASAGLGLSIYRVALRLVLRILRSHNHNTRNFVVAGAGQLGFEIAHRISQKPSLGLKFKGFYDDAKTPMYSEHCMGTLEQLIDDCRSGNIDRVYIALPMRAEPRIKWLIQKLADSTASVYLVPNVFMFNLLHARTDTLDGIPTISIYDTPIDGSNAVLKRIEDIVLASVILCLITPVLLVIAAAVKLTSKGPVLFKQLRYGIDGKPIEVWKFRTMSVMENGSNVQQATKNDPRLTSIGGFLRGTSLDELPQFFNVLNGQMSIVGPRPHAVQHNEEYRQLIDGYMLRHKVKPGITGWAQINGWRGETDVLDKMEKRVEYDLDYITNWSVWFDLKIVFKTVFKGFINKNAY